METFVWAAAAAALFTTIMTGAGALPAQFVKSLGQRTIGRSTVVVFGLTTPLSH